MENKNKNNTGYVIVTYRVRLYDRHFKWMKATNELYICVVKHFLNVLRNEKELLVQSDFLLLRILETKCIGTKEMKAAGILPEYPLLDFPKIPLYFRRSAINTAIDLARKQAEFINPNITLYKGMYRNFTDCTIELKLFNGEKWVWVEYPFTGRTFPKDVTRLSPMLVLEKKNAWLEVPISFEVEDVRTVKERMQTEECICALSFPDNDVLAVAVILSKEAKEIEYNFFRGGKQKEHQRRKILKQLQYSKKSRGIVTRTKKNQKVIETMPVLIKENSHLYEELHEINQYYAHCISKQILEYCLERNIKIIVVPNYETSIDFRNKAYLKTDNYRWIGRAIIKNLKYKAFKQGIVVTSIRPCHISDCCSECGAKIRKYNEGHTAGQNYYGGRLFLCPNGHTGNVARNTARNVGKQFLSYYKS